MSKQFWRNLLYIQHALMSNWWTLRCPKFFFGPKLKFYLFGTRTKCVQYIVNVINLVTTAKKIRNFPFFSLFLISIWNTKQFVVQFSCRVVYICVCVWRTIELHHIFSFSKRGICFCLPFNNNNDQRTMNLN